MADELKAVSAVQSQMSGDSHRFVPFGPPAPMVSPVGGASQAADRHASLAGQNTAQLSEALEEMRESVERGRTDLQFRVEKELGRVVVSVIDPKDGKVLRQIPGEEVLRIARMLNGKGGTLIQAQA